MVGRNSSNGGLIMEIITRQDAMEQGLKRYFTGEPCKHGHVCEKYCCRNTCVNCVALKTDAFRNKEKYKRQGCGIYRLKEAKKLGLEFYNNGRPCKNGVFGMRKTKCGGSCFCSSCYKEKKERAMKWQEKKRRASGVAPRSCSQQTKEQRKSYYKKWVEKNRKKVNDRHKKWVGKNREKLRPYQSAYNAIRWKRTSDTLAKLHFEKIVTVYKKRDRIIKETGIEHHVDHIVPLLGKNVCGLHVPWNMQIIPAKQNRVKSNKWDCG